MWSLPSSVVVPTRIGLALILFSAVASVVLFSQRLPRRYILLWLAFLALSIHLGIRGLEWEDLRSAAIYSSLAPVFVLTSGVLFIGADRRSWTMFRRIAIIIAFAVSLLAISQVILLASSNRGEAYGRLSVYAGILGGWLPSAARDIGRAETSDTAACMASARGASYVHNSYAVEVDGSRGVRSVYRNHFTEGKVQRLATLCSPKRFGCVISRW